MGDFFEERKNNQYQFRQNIDKFMKQCDSIETENQLDQASLFAILSNSKNQMFQGGKISLEKVYQIIRNEEGGQTFSFSDFQSIFGPQKYIKVSELANMLKKFNLQSFDLKAEMSQHFFENKKMSMQKLDKTMKKLGYQQLNKKNKEMLVDCFDFNSNKVIDFQDINTLIQLKQEKKRKQNDN